MTSSSALEWFAVRCIFRAGSNKPWGPHDLGPDESAYEERITLWRARTADDAIRLAEDEAKTYEEQIEVEYLGLAQSYRLPDSADNGEEIFSLVRKSDLSSSDYLDRFFDTGTEYQRATNRPAP